MKDYKKELLSRISNLLEGEWDVPTFQKNYYFYYLNEVPDGALTTNESLFFSSIKEKLDFTDEKPDEESRKYGWINHQEYIDWVREKVKSLPN